MLLLENKNFYILESRLATIRFNLTHHVGCREKWTEATLIATIVCVSEYSGDASIPNHPIRNSPTPRIRPWIRIHWATHICTRTSIHIYIDLG